MDELKNDIVIPLKGLAQGEHSFRFVVNGEFFQGFDNGQIKDADCTVKAQVTRNQTMAQIFCRMSGFVIVECDRCLDDLVLKVDVERELTVGFGTVDIDSADEQEDVIVIDPSEGEVNISQFVYDYICLSLPMVKVHPEGKCNPEMLSRICAETGEPKETNSPFSALKDMIEEKNN